MQKVRLFVDFWNLQLSWNRQTNQEYGRKTMMAWNELPGVLTSEAMHVAGIDNYRYDGTRIYASADLSTEQGKRLNDWLENFINMLPGVNVVMRERFAAPFSVHCSECDQLISECPSCNKRLYRSKEKGVDSAIITDLFSLAWEDAYDIAVLVSTDTDYIPPVERIQERGFKIINATWDGAGQELSRACWASFNMNNLIPSLVKEDHYQQQV